MSDTVKSPTEFNHLPYAGVVPRLIALIYDALIVAGLWMVYGFFALLVATTFGGLQCQPEHIDYTPCVGGPLYQFGLLLVTAGYFFWSWRAAGQTIGMRAWRLMVANNNGVQLSWYQCCIRALVGPLSVACLGLGYFWGYFRPDRASWHDLASDSEVRQLPKKKKKKSL
ncbi:RDD family protein [Microbulbifer agarilyticus]|uniref:RDD family protein n=1 Tax=Microbulbifer agarilyticus TaxID=260552 RepID=UPI001C96007A|nr:RDD family protein [Microbulbifer agarilyticus]MBY6191351.1 RDD family protein [Microbulbifer agarilyticus]MBY6212737.1 RDD family protein [Microbulbifer agarilyticus]MCA0894351.1 RDD family protein [Microbulbifer agarilyticus]MCA0901865.1 RDD family protein [Microbulbifer agarilyticus]